MIPPPVDPGLPIGPLTQAIDYLAIAPPLLVAAGAVAALLVALFAPARRGAAEATGLASVLLGLALLGWSAQSLPAGRETFCVPADALGSVSCSYVVDSLTVPLQALVLLGTAVVLLLSWGAVRDEALPAGEYVFLLLCSAAGALALVAARDLITLVVALEVVSLPVFGLVALRRTAAAAEAGLKFFLLSVIATAVTLMGAAMIYGITGAVHFDRIAAALAAPGVRAPATLTAAALLLTGFAFKVAAVPFHAWAPEVYSGAPVPVAAYLSVVSKAAGFAALLLVLTVAFARYASAWAPLVAVLAALTMTVGNIVALRQRSAVRLLAWSSVAQSGYVLAPLAAGAVLLPEARAAALAYLLAYAVMNLAAFTVVAVVRRVRPADSLADYVGLARTEPLTAVALAFALACLAGLPPGLLGLFAKIAVFRPPVEAGVTWLAVVMAVNVVLGLAYYLPWAASMWARPERDAPPPSYRLSVPDGLALGATFAAVVALSVLPVGIFGSAAV